MFDCARISSVNRALDCRMGGHGFDLWGRTNRQVVPDFQPPKNVIFQRAKKVVSNSPGLVDFAIGLVNSVFNFPDGQVMFNEEFE